jgi:hypothetical protein
MMAGENDWEDIAPEAKKGGGTAVATKPPEDQWEDIAPQEKTTTLPPAAKQPPPGPIKRAVTSFAGVPEETNLTDVSGFKDPAEWGKAVVSAAKGVSAVPASMDAADTAMERLKQPGFLNKALGGLEYVESGLPYVGPMTVAAHEKFANKDYAGGLGASLSAGLAATGLAKSAPAIADASASKLNSLGPSVDKATDLYQRAVKPGSVTPEEEEQVRGDFKRAARYIGPEAQRQAVPGDRTGVATASRIAGNAATKLWDSQVQPLRQQFGNVESSGSDVATEVRKSVTNLDAATKEPVVTATNKLAQFFDRPMTVGEKFDLVTQLNNDKAVSRWYDMSPSEQTQAEIADPSLRGKVAAVNALRGSLFEDVNRIGGEKLGARFQEARKDFGALRSVQRTLYENTKVPTPQGFASRALNTVRSLWRPEYLATRETLGRMNNPNSLTSRAFNMLGKVPGLETPETLPPRPVPPGPPVMRPGTQLPLTEELRPGPTAPPNSSTPAQPNLFDRAVTQLRTGAQGGMRRGADTAANLPVMQIRQGELPPGNPQTATIQSADEAKLDAFLRSRLPQRALEQIRKSK